MRSIFSAASAVALGLVLALLGGELLLRVSGVWIGRHSDTMFTVIEHDARLGWKMPPNVSRRVDFVDVEGIAVRSNSAGFWDEEFTRTKSAGVCRVAFLGDSFTWGMGVEEGERFSNLIENGPGERRVESLNFGIPGFGTDQALLAWEHEARRYGPDVVVLTVYENDYYDNLHEVRYGRAKPYFETAGRDMALRNVPVARTDFWDHGVYNRIAAPYAGYFDAPVQHRSRPLHWLVKHSDLVRLAYRVSQSDVVSRRAARSAPVAVPRGAENAPRHLQRAAESPPRETRRQTPDQTPQTTSRKTFQLDLQHDLQRRLILALRNGVRDGGARLVVAFAGKRHAGTASDMAALREEGVPVVDATTDAISPKMPRHEPVYFPFNQHWTPAAHRTAAELIGERLDGLCGDVTDEPTR